MTITGGCHCGAIRYQAEGEALTHALCHCTDCRRHAGAPMVGWTMYPRAALTVTKGTPRIYASSEHGRRHFCPDCGTGLFYENAEMLPYDDYYILKPVTLEKNVWIGANVSICPGVRVGEGAVIALGSVVTKDVPKYSIIGGNPAKILKMRDKEQYNKLNQNKMHYLRLKKEGKTSIKFISGPTFEDKVC